MSALLRWRLDEQPRSVGHTLVNCGSWLASDGGLAAAASLKDVPHSNCRSEPARDGGLAADKFSAGVHIHSCGNGLLWFRSYSESLLSNDTKGTKKSCPTIRPLAGARGSLTPALLRGRAAKGPPWPIAASSASLPNCPLRKACVRPPGNGAGGSRSKARSKAKAVGVGLPRRPGCHPSLREWAGFCGGGQNFVGAGLPAMAVFLPVKKHQAYRCHPRIAAPTQPTVEL